MLNNFGVYWFMPVASGYNQTGVPDFIACINGAFVAVEAKSVETTHGVTALQEKHIKNIRRNNGYALVVDERNFDELEQLIKDLQGGKKC